MILYLLRLGLFLAYTLPPLSHTTENHCMSDGDPYQETTGKTCCIQ